VSKVGVAIANVDHGGGHVTADLDTLLTALYVLADDLLPRRPRARRHPRITDAELVCLAVAQILLDCPSERRFLRFAMVRLGHLFPYLPKQPGYNKRMRALNIIAMSSPSWCDNVRLLDSTPVPCGASRETVKRSAFGGHAGYGYCASHSRYFWGFRLYLLCAPDGMPIASELAPANAPEREVAAEMLARVDLDGYTVIADKGFAGQDFEALLSLRCPITILIRDLPLTCPSSRAPAGGRSAPQRFPPRGSCNGQAHAEAQTGETETMYALGDALVALSINH
jgi:hypothetical protein